MAIVVETGAGLSNANSYVSVAEADAYLEDTNRAAVDPWGKLGEHEKAGLLVLATNYLTARFGTRWLGTQYNENQRLDWPRFDVAKKSGHYYSSDEIPQEVKWAQIEYALLEAGTPNSLFPTIQYDATNRPLKSIREKVDVLEEERVYADSPAVIDWRKYPIADGLLRHLVRRSGTLLRA